MRDFYTVLMDPAKNPLSGLPKVQRFQIMTYLGIMWSTLFTFGIGYWAIYGQLVVFHVLLALGVTFTATTFFEARQQSHRDVIKRADGTPMYDDIWGAP